MRRTETPWSRRVQQKPRHLGEQFAPEEQVSDLPGHQHIETERSEEYLPPSLPEHQRPTTFAGLRKQQEHHKARTEKRSREKEAEAETLERYKRLKEVPPPHEIEQRLAEQQAESIRIAEQARKFPGTGNKVNQRELKRRKEHQENREWFLALPPEEQAEFPPGMFRELPPLEADMPPLEAATPPRKSQKSRVPPSQHGVVLDKQRAAIDLTMDTPEKQRATPVRTDIFKQWLREVAHGERVAPWIAASRDPEAVQQRERTRTLTAGDKMRREYYQDHVQRYATLGESESYENIVTYLQRRFKAIKGTKSSRKRVTASSRNISNLIRTGPKDKEEPRLWLRKANKILKTNISKNDRFRLTNAMIDVSAEREALLYGPQPIEVVDLITPPKPKKTRVEIDLTGEPKRTAPVTRKATVKPRRDEVAFNRLRQANTEQQRISELGAQAFGGPVVAEPTPPRVEPPWSTRRTLEFDSPPREETIDEPSTPPRVDSPQETFDEPDTSPRVNTPGSTRRTIDFDPPQETFDEPSTPPRIETPPRTRRALAEERQRREDEAAYDRLQAAQRKALIEQREYEREQRRLKQQQRRLKDAQERAEKQVANEIESSGLQPHEQDEIVKFLHTRTFNPKDALNITKQKIKEIRQRKEAKRLSLMNKARLANQQMEHAMRQVAKVQAKWAREVAPREPQTPPKTPPREAPPRKPQTLPKTPPSKAQRRHRRKLVFDSPPPAVFESPPLVGRIPVELPPIELPPPEPPVRKPENTQVRARVRIRSIEPSPYDSPPGMVSDVSSVSERSLRRPKTPTKTPPPKVKATPMLRMRGGRHTPEKGFPIPYAKPDRPPAPPRKKAPKKPPPPRKKAPAKPKSKRREYKRPPIRRRRPPEPRIAEQPRPRRRRRAVQSRTERRPMVLAQLKKPTFSIRKAGNRYTLTAKAGVTDSILSQIKAFLNRTSGQPYVDGNKMTKPAALRYISANLSKKTIHILFRKR